jgi:hypothetical protein
MITTNDLILYFEEIISNLKDENLSEDLKFQLTLIYIRDKYNKKEEEKEEKDEMKYFALGWYIYKFLLKK